ncbi:O-antigen ligase family protein [Candidatus Electronema sp. PJ]|uniref:O-antigen ligase family protein n=1 Tax=Candidatus Electronema sp. PJ TaxID=3401572 RepID=UPI003AA88E22
MNARLHSIREGAGRANSWLLGLLAFVLPLSTSAVSAVALLVLLLWLIEGNYIEKCAEALFTPVAVVVLGYLALLCLGLFWTAHPINGFAVLQDHWKIALLPVFLTAARFEQRSFYLGCFLFGMSMAMLITYLAWFDLVQYSDVHPGHITPKTFHVVYNPLLAFAIYLTLHKAIWEERKSQVQAALFLLAGLMVLNMFITEGRTGQAVFFVLISLLLFQIFRKNRFWAVLSVCLLLPTGGAVGYLASPVFQQRVDLALKEISGFQQNPNTSVGLRLQFCQNSLALFQQHPCIGVGTGDFKAAYAKINRKRSPRSLATDNPHNQYLLTAVMLGLPGLFALLLIFMVMFIQARTEEDNNLKRVRIAFPLFFLLIMLAESYLKVYQTAFFFALFAAVLYKKQPLPQSENRCWLILSYRANILGSACSQHIDDRLPHLQAQEIEPVLLTGPVGEQAKIFRHFRALSIAPSGIRFELRHFLRRHLHKRWQFKTAETLILLPLLPFYLLEKIIVNLESEWSWCLLASLRGLLLCRQLKPELIYSTGGSASAHVAALLIKAGTGIRWIAETQDPLVHDQDWRRSRLVLLLYKTLEQRICRQADLFVFLVGAAMEHCRQRTKSCQTAVVYPGAEQSWFGQVQYSKGDRCRFAHFGSLAGTRNLAVFFQALEQVVSRRPELHGLVLVDVYGSFDSLSEREMKRLRLQDLVVLHGPVARQEAIATMQQADCLLLIQNIIYFSCETIPSKVYEYLLTGRPILGLLHHNQELEAMLTENGHCTVPADDVQATAAAIEEILSNWLETGLPTRSAAKAWTVTEAVQKLISLAEIEFDDKKV